MLIVDTEGFLAIVLAAAVAALISGRLGRRFVAPVVVIEILLGILIGPEVLGLVEADEFIRFFASLGLGMLFFFAGYEIDFARIRGAPLRLAALGWLFSLALAYALGGLLVAAGLAISLLFVGSAMASTAIGTLIPILSDAGETRTRFGRYLLAAGAAGEFGPILLVTLLFSTRTTVASALILLAFAAIAALATVAAVRSAGRGWEMIERTLESSSQLAIRLTVLIVFLLAAVAADLGLDLLLGGFVAGIIVSIAARGRETAVLESKLAAVGYGFLIPFFFIFTGVDFDLRSLTDDPIRLLELPMFLAMFLVVRGVPALVLYRRLFELRDRAALALYSATELPLVVAITTIAVERGDMRSGTAAALVGAAVLSTAIYPLIALGLRRRGNAPSG